MSDSKEKDILLSTPTPCDKPNNETEHERSDPLPVLEEMRPLDSLSMKSDRSINQPLDFKKSRTCSDLMCLPDWLEGPMKYTSHNQEPLDFKKSRTFSECDQQSSESSAERLKESVGSHLEIDSEQQSFSGQNKQTVESCPSQTESNRINYLFQCLGLKINNFVQNELKKFQNILNNSLAEKEETSDDHEQGQNTRDAFLKFTLHFLRGMKEKDVADSLERKMVATTCRWTLKSKLKMKSRHMFEGITKTKKQASLKQIYTELFITEGRTACVSNKQGVSLLETESRKPPSLEKKIIAKDLFKASADKNESNRTVMTNGVAGIGKTVLTQKFTLDWAEGKANQDIQFTFPFSFRELNLLKEKTFSLVELIHHFFPETKEIFTFEEFKILFIFDGLDECRLPLNMKSTETLKDVTVSTSLDVLLTNLIKGNLLPSAHLWITTRPAAASQIPPECVDLVTEVRGFTDPQKEEYFNKRFTEEEQASRIISHVKSSRSLHIMCHIPIFCWISATVLQDMLKTTERGELPKSLTEMFIHFLVVQCKVKKVKFDEGAEADSHFSPDTKKMIESLGKLAFEQLLKGNIYFYESDLMQCGINVREASVYSGVFTQIFQEERGLNQNKMFSFVHLTVQEFLAALYVHLTFTNTGVNLLEKQPPSCWSTQLENKSHLFYQSAVNMTLNSPNGQLDLFLRFLLGLSLQTNQALLQGLVTQTESSSRQKTVEYIKRKISENVDPEKSINLFHCLNELKDCSLVEGIQENLRSGRLSVDKLSSSQWSALVFILLTSEEGLDEFDLKKYSASEEALLRLLSVVKASTKAVLSGCYLSEKSCEALARVLGSKSSKLKELDLSNNDLQDSGVKLLCEGLQSPHCILETLWLSGCLITHEGCAALASAVRSNPSLTVLDLSYNHLEDTGVDQLSAADCGLKELKTDHSEVKMMVMGLRKYACELTMDPNTAHRKLVLSENNRKVTLVDDEQPYSDHPERFDFWIQVMCTDGLSTTDRCYWEVEREGTVLIALGYKGMKRKGRFDDSRLGGNHQSWSLKCSDDDCSFMHNNVRKTINVTPSSRVGVYLDYPASTLSFYSVSSEKIHLHTIHTTFTEPLYLTFRLNPRQQHCSVTLCQI